MIKLSVFFQIAIAGCLLAPHTMAQARYVNTHVLLVKPKRAEVTTGADQTYKYLDYLKGKKIGMVVNQTSIIGKNKTATVDSLLTLGISVTKIFGPEHGFRGTASNGATVNNTVDAKTGIPVISLYGSKHYKPTPEDLKDLDLVIFDIQDVGVRFYTYLSTLQYVMEACAENNVELMVLDRPNPNGFYVDGPVLDTALRSFVGLNTIPVVYGLTIAEYAKMLNGEGWLKNRVQCKLKIITLANYTHSSAYVLPVNPSPNLNTEKSILLYPSVCLFEGTSLSLGRGTIFPFLQVGHPALNGKYNYSFTPVSIAGMSEDPPQRDKVCYGINLKDYNTNTIRESGKLNLTWLIELYKAYPDKEHFFNAYFAKLAGTEKLKQAIIDGKTEQEIQSSWEPQLNTYRIIRNKYLLYK